MAELSNADRRELWARFMRINDAPTPFSKSQLRAAVDLMDAWIEANQSNLIGALQAVTVGDATFAEATDTWTLTGHGLVVGDWVRFTAVGTGAEEYVVDTNYWVAAIPDVNSFQLAPKAGGAVIDGTTDSVGTWTLQNRKGQDFLDGSTAAQKARLFAEIVMKRYDVGA